MATLSKIKTTRSRQKLLEKLSPFELKNDLIVLAKEYTEKSTNQMLNAGRGNPNWIATTPREAFFTLGAFALEECRSTMNEPAGLAGNPQKTGIAKRFEKFLSAHKTMPGADLLKKTYKYGISTHSFDPDAWVMELAESIIGCQYPTPDRILHHTEVIVHDYLMQEMCANTPPKGFYDIFAVEGGTAAMCYIFDSIMQNFLARRGDKIALMVPTFTPYIEIPQLDRYNFKVVNIHASSHNKDGRHTWQYPDEELNKLKDPRIKILFVVNPSNPPSYAIDADGLKKIISIVKKDNPNLMVVTDDVYGTFVPGFRSLMAAIPHNTIGVYSFSKYFGCTGWRLGAVAIHENNVFDKKIAALSPRLKAMLHKRYESISLEPAKIKFIDRMVADSRQVALNHTAGLSLPQQTQMLLFCTFALTDAKNKYKKLTQDIVQKRLSLLWKGLGLPLIKDPMNAGYYAQIDIRIWAVKKYGEPFFRWMKKHVEPTDFLFRLAEKTGIVLLNGGGFDAPEWSIRVSLANLHTEEYSVIGEQVHNIMQEYVAAWQGKEYLHPVRRKTL